MNKYIFTISSIFIMLLFLVVSVGVIIYNTGVNSNDLKVSLVNR